MGPTQLKCRLLISSIYYVMNFRPFLEMLEFNLWHFWKIILFLKFLLTVLQQVPKHLVGKTNDLGMVDCLKELVKNNWISQLLEWTRKGINTYNFFGQRGWKFLKIMYQWNQEKILKTINSRILGCAPGNEMENSNLQK